uniref:Odorant binding protein 9 n=1 Tax=Sclerodermus sp. MQW-2015 TaxID=1729718 RepID=A0A0N9JZG0_9HYME|nr:odorant binding protein 9 [Sclerodermus sp. MQW-2015]
MQPKVAAAAILVVAALQAVSVCAERPAWITQEILDMIANDKNNCMAEHGTTEAQVDSVNNGQLPEDRSITCYMFCMFDTFAVVDEDGVLDADTLSSFFPEEVQEKARGAFGPCSEPPGDDNCDKMKNLAKCIHEHDPSMLFMI